MRLDASELWWIRYCCAEEQRYRATGQRGRRGPVSPQLSQLIRRLELEAAVSQTRQAESDELSPSNHDQDITTAEAADILGWCTRTVQRRYADLEGRMVGHQLVFRSATVHAYAGALTDGRDIA